MSAATYDISRYLDAAREFAARVALHAERIDDARELPDELAREMADKGFFRLLAPRSLGGAELDLPDYLRLVEVFAEVDASTAWTFNQNNVWATNSTRVPPQTAREIWADPRAVVTNGPPLPGARAEPADGGYLLSGRWTFSTGCDHATWIAAMAPVAADGETGPLPVDDQSAPVMLVPKSAVNIVDDWHVNGLRGTASYGFEVDGLFVPSARTFSVTWPPREDGPLYVLPTTLLFASGFSTITLGVARASLDVAIDVAGGKVPARMRGKLRDYTTTQREVGEAMANWRSAKAFLREAVGQVWQSARHDGSLTIDDRISLRIATTHAIRMAAKVVDSAYNLCGSGAIFKGHPIQRRFQDAHVITQHLQGRMTHYDTAGQYYLGLEPRGQF